jgi:hypothetical protein
MWNFLLGALIVASASVALFVLVLWLAGWSAQHMPNKHDE